MIDTRTEELLTLSAAARRLPGRRSGKCLAASTLWRWSVRGIGAVRLEAVRIGGTTYTSAEALQRFAERTTAAANHEPAPAATVAQRRRAIEAAEQELIAAGL